jgi:hypothetical protein
MGDDPHFRQAPRVAPIYRAPMRARELDLPAGAGADFGLEHGVVGIGNASDRALDRFAGLPDGTFVWTRDSAGAYHLGRIAGPCRDDTSAAAQEVGIRHVRVTTWLPRPFAEDEVPPAVAATFARGGRNFQRTHSETAERRTAELWCEHAVG